MERRDFIKAVCLAAPAMAVVPTEVFAKLPEKLVRNPKIYDTVNATRYINSVFIPGESTNTSKAITGEEYIVLDAGGYGKAETMSWRPEYFGKTEEDGWDNFWDALYKYSSREPSKKHVYWRTELEVHNNKITEKWNSQEHYQLQSEVFDSRAGGKWKFLDNAQRGISILEQTVTPKEDIKYYVRARLLLSDKLVK